MDYSSFVDKNVSDIDDKIKIDIETILIDRKVNNLISDVKINRNEKVSNLTERFLSKLKRFEPYLTKIFKGANRLNVKYGGSYWFWDIKPNLDIDIGVCAIPPNSPQNEIFRINQTVPFAGLCYRTPFTCTWSTLGVYEIRTPNEKVTYTLNPGTGKTIPTPYGTINLPYELEQLLGQIAHGSDGISEKLKEFTGTSGMYKYEKTNYGEMSLVFWPNKDSLVLDEKIMSDIYPVRDLIKPINRMLNFDYDEMLLDKTRILGNFDNATLSAIGSQLGEVMKGFKQEEINRYVALQTLQDRLIIQTAPTMGQNNIIEKMQTTYEGAKHVDGVNSKIDLLFRMCEETWQTGEKRSQYVNNAETNSKNNLSLLSVKKKLPILKKFLVEFFGGLFRAWCRKALPKNKLKNIDFDAYLSEWSVDITSNLLVANQKSTDAIDDIIKEKQNGLIDQKSALKYVHPDKTAGEIEEMYNLITKEQEQLQQQNEDMIMSRNKEGDTIKSENQKTNKKEYDKKRIGTIRAKGE